MKFAFFLFSAFFLLVLTISASAANQDCTSEKFLEIKGMIAKKSYDDAEASAKQQYAQCNDKGLLSYELAEIAERKGDTHKSYDYLKETVNEVEAGRSKDISSESSYYELGRIALKNGKYDESISYLKKVESLNEQHENLQYTMGLDYEDLKKTDEGMEYFGKCLKSDNNAAYQRYCYQKLHPAEIITDKDQFKDALMKAKALEKDARLEEFRKSSFYPDFGPEAASIFKNCFATLKSASTDPFDAVMQFNSSGNVEKIFLDHRTNTADCFTDSIKHDVFPAPPISEFYEELDLKFK